MKINQSRYLATGLCLLLFPLLGTFSFAKNNENTTEVAADVNVSKQQTALRKLIKQGIKWYDEGQYDKAIAVYQQGLKRYPDNPEINYELAMTYFAKKDFAQSLEMVDKMIDVPKFAVVATALRSSVLDNLGKSDEAIANFESGIKRFTEQNKDGYLVAKPDLPNAYQLYSLFYNLAISYQRLGKYELAQKNALNTIYLNPNYPSGHWLLAVSARSQDQRVQSFIASYYFLLLEPVSQRTDIAVDTLMFSLPGYYNPSNGNIAMPKVEDAEIGALNLALSVITANLVKDSEKLTKAQQFNQATSSFFTIVGELMVDNKASSEHATDIWHQYYAPFYQKLARSRHMQTATYWVRQSADEEAAKWLKAHPQETQQFMEWLTSNLISAN